MVSFYKSLVHYNELFYLANFSLIQNQTYYKIIRNWQVYQYNSNYFSELYYAVYLSHIGIKENNITNLINDVNQVFFNKYLKDPTQQTYSSFIQIFFYINTNMYHSIQSILSSLNIEIINKLSDYLKAHKLSQFLVLFLLIGWLISFFGVSILIFFKYNKGIFRVIVSMFFDENIHSKNDFMNKAENHFMKQLIKNFIQLLRNFNEEKFNHPSKFKKR